MIAARLKAVRNYHGRTVEMKTEDNHHSELIIKCSKPSLDRIMDPTYPLVPIANMMGCALVVIPLFHMVTRSWNTGIYVFALWTSLSCLSMAINTIAWSSSMADKMPVWCDISSHLQVAANVGIPACSLIITRRMYKITRLQNPMDSKRQKRIELSLELAISIGWPIVITGLCDNSLHTITPLLTEFRQDYIVQGSRYFIVEQLGCSPAEVFSGVSIMVIDSWTIIFPVTSLILYTPQIIYTFYRHRREMNEHFDNNDEELSQSHFYRMLMLGCFDIFITLPISIILLVSDINDEGSLFEFFQGWSIHSDWEPIFVPRSTWSENKWTSFIVHWNDWINVFLALVFFAIFGLTAEARKGYRKFFCSKGGLFGARRAANTEELFPEIVFDGGRGTNATMMSNASSRTQAD